MTWHALTHSYIYFFFLYAVQIVCTSSLICLLSFSFLIWSVECYNPLKDMIWHIKDFALDSSLPLSFTTHSLFLFLFLSVAPFNPSPPLWIDLFDPYLYSTTHTLFLFLLLSVAPFNPSPPLWIDLFDPYLYSHLCIAPHFSTTPPPSDVHRRLRYFTGIRYGPNWWGASGKDSSRANDAQHEVRTLTLHCTALLHTALHFTALNCRLEVN